VYIFLFTVTRLDRILTEFITFQDDEPDDRNLEEINNIKEKVNDRNTDNAYHSHLTLTLTLG